MKKLAFIFLFLLITTLLNAQTYKSIRVGSFAKKSNAENALVSLKSYIASQKKILNYQKRLKFRAQVVKVGKYYMDVVEPFYGHEKEIQEIVDIIRNKYSYAYIRKIRDAKKSVHAESRKLEKTSKKVKVLEKKNVVVEKKREQETVKNVDLVVSEIDNKIAVVAKNKVDKTKNIVNTKEKSFATKKVVQEKMKEEQKLSNPVVENTLDSLPARLIQKDKKIASSLKTTSVLNNTVKSVTGIKEKKAVDNSVWKLLFSLTLALLVALVIKIYLDKKKAMQQLQKRVVLDEKKREKEEQKLSKEKFISHISHELRTPMTSILGLTHLVLEDNLTLSQRENIQKIEGSGQHMLSILNDILDASKIEAGEFKVQNSEFNINDTLDYVLNIMAIQAQNNNNEIITDVAKDVPSVLIGDSLRLGQILINIIGNAIKYTKDGTIELYVKKFSSNGNIVTLSFDIKDSGVGMNEAEVANVFRPYSQTTSGESSELSGTGLGLSISKQLIEKMGGEIYVTSKLGEGTKFSFNINFKVRDIKNRRKYRLPSTKFLNKSILIIDDKNDDIEMLEESLNYFKYRVKTVSRLSSDNFNQHFDIVMLGSKMVTSDVINDLVIIKSLNSSLKIVIVDELDNNFDEAVIQTVEIDAFLKKPFSKQAILNLIIDLYVSKKVDKLQRNKESKEKLAQFAGKKILVAEDNEVNHKVIAGFLAGTGIELEFVADGKLAFEAYKNDLNIDLILMDINMPMVNGYEATQEIRIEEEDSDREMTPILALTADVMDDAIVKALASGMQGYISKPIVVDKFYKTIYDFLSAKKSKPKEIAIKEPLSPIENDKITELSISAGIKRCADDESFYNSMLEEFKNDFATSSQRVEELCENGDFIQAKKVCEEIRDFAVNIGAYNLAEGLETLEYELEKAEKGNWKKLVSFYANLLQKLLTDIEKQINK